MSAERRSYSGEESGRQIGVELPWNSEEAAEQGLAFPSGGLEAEAALVLDALQTLRKQHFWSLLSPWIRDNG
ncbi:hypothetical protein NDU88_001647 [Pleurodeles waltl]|uniref:Uncharacterized protein n=1 Tax=Pleurodeles waltl TaxID=8319 RepID=A0AAV7U7L1_PLEWA|nr:hypothetical protein NDU88_001647 [Pleurodeles waltl]